MCGLNEYVIISRFATKSDSRESNHSIGLSRAATKEIILVTADTTPANEIEIK